MSRLWQRKPLEDSDIPVAYEPAPGSPPPAAIVSGTEPWQQIEVDEAGPVFEARPPSGPDCFSFPDSECDGWSTSDLTMRYASVRGARHRYHRLPRQDSVRAALHEQSGTIVFAVADGVSSASISHRGAHAVCETSVRTMLDGLSREPTWADFDELARRSAEELHALTRWWLGEARPNQSQVMNLYATTLVAGLVWAHQDGPVVELCRIGDSAAWILDLADGRYHPLFGAEVDEVSDVVSTNVIPLPHVPEQMERVTRQLSSSQVLLVGTDGFGLPLGDGDGRIGALFARHLESPPTPPWFAHVLDFSRATFDDDRTLLAVWPSTPSRPQ
ncbi:protein phosphatase 2C domain-containing protein [Nocardia sp. NPDC006630]|uniref:protein phosphatase 2C domain-containing protein n=1 Tax=Nocardia sp. NPDC006630 TaxID=3157181 RepID=UPI0033AB3C93